MGNCRDRRERCEILSREGDVAMDFSGKAFVIMGAASGVGRELCRMLAKNNASLFMTGRDIEKLETLRSSVMNPERHVCSVVNITEDSFQTMQKELATFMAERKLQGIDGGVYCPGTAPALPLRALTLENITQTVNVNFSAAMIFTKILAKKPFRKSSGGSVVWISSIRSRRGAKALSVYCGTKAALVGACRALAIELAPQKVRLNCVAPGSMGTNMNMQTAKISPDYLHTMADRHPLGTGTPEDAANAIAFLLSDESKWITGTELVVDGGFLA